MRRLGFVSASNGLLSTTFCSSSIERTITLTSRASAFSISFAGSLRVVLKSTLPLCRNVRTSDRPASSQSDFSSAIGRRFFPPTFMPRRKATKWATLRRVYVPQRMREQESLHETHPETLHDHQIVIGL